MVDLWSLGVIMFEIFFKKHPFGADEADSYIIYQEILNGKIEYPETEDKEALSLMQKLLSHSPETRLGENYSALKIHPWFKTIDWVPTPFSSLNLIIRITSRKALRRSPIPPLRCLSPLCRTWTK